MCACMIGHHFATLDDDVLRCGAGFARFDFFSGAHWAFVSVNAAYWSGSGQACRMGI